jgi:hypothetical protein
MFWYAGYLNRSEREHDSLADHAADIKGMDPELAKQLWGRCFSGLEIVAWM